MNDPQHFEKDLAEIRSLMEKSAKFISLSGLSGILAGVYALMGSAAAYYLVGMPISRMEYNDGAVMDTSIAVKLGVIAVIVLVASVVTGLSMSARKAKKQGGEFWNTTSKKLVVDLAIPLVTGGIFILLMVDQGRFSLVAPACLVFYGLALINASSHLFDEVRYLGYSEIILGLIATAFLGYSLLFWTIGFGLFHVFYGAIMFRKYDR